MLSNIKRRFHKNGNVSFEESIEGGAGYTKKWHENGQLSLHSEFSFPEFSRLTEYYANGAIKAKASTRYDVTKKVDYDENGSVIRILRYMQGELHGDIEEYTKDGNLIISKFERGIKLSEVSKLRHEDNSEIVEIGESYQLLNEWIRLEGRFIKELDRSQSIELTNKITGMAAPVYVYQFESEVQSDVCLSILFSAVPPSVEDKIVSAATDIGLIVMSEEIDVSQGKYFRIKF